MSNHFHIDLPFSSFRLFPICLLRFLISPVLFSSVMQSLHCHASFYLSQCKQTPLIFQDADSPFLGNLHQKGELFANTENPVPMPGNEQWLQQLLKTPCPLSAVQLIPSTSDFLQNSRNHWQTGLNASWHTSFIYPMRYYPKGKEAEGNENLTESHSQSKRPHRRKEISHQQRAAKNTREQIAQHFVVFVFRRSNNTFWGHPLFMLALKFKSQVRARTPTMDPERWLGQSKNYFLHSQHPLKLQQQWKWSHLLYESFSCLWQVNRMKAGKMDWKWIF